MRNVVAYFLYALDGVVESPEKWVFDRFDDEMRGHLKSLIERQSTVLLGRKTYELWQSYWPNSTIEPFATFINTTPKHVASTTLDEVTWSNANLIKGNVADEVKRLKAEPGRDIGIHGSTTLVRYLLLHGLIDELKLAMFPAAAGQGDRLFDGIEQPQRLRLDNVEHTGKGVALLTYHPQHA
jgi:dihydrofolate reductase